MAWLADLQSKKRGRQRWRPILFAFGGIVVTNRTVDKAAAEAINSIFFEVIIAPSYDKEALKFCFRRKIV